MLQIFRFTKIKMQNNWTNGYVADITYSHGYYHELAPSFLRFALLMNGLANGRGSDSDYTYCELGYGQGVSANVHAAANPRGRFWGTDFNPDHALFAQGSAQQAGVPSHWLAASFEALLDEDLPQFDFITLHGVWSWVDAATHHAIVEFIRRRLKVGGVVYISYNVMPGWAAEKPVRDLLWMHTELAGARGDATASRIAGAIDFAQRLRQGGATYFAQDARACDMLDDIRRDDVHVVAHEYFNQSWHLTYFADLARSLEAATLSFACSVHKSDLAGLVAQRRGAFDLDDLGLNSALRQTTDDFILNRRFRRDIFVRGAERLSAAQRETQLKALGLVLLHPAASMQPRVVTPYGAVDLDPDLCRQLLSALDRATAPMALGEVMAQAGLTQGPAQPVFQTVAAWVAQGNLAVVFPEDAQRASSAHTQALNQALAQRACGGDMRPYLASPVTGQAIEVNPVDGLCLLAWDKGARTGAALAAWLHHEGVSDARAQASRFLQEVAPGWCRLGVLAQEAA